MIKFLYNFPTINPRRVLVAFYSLICSCFLLSLTQATAAISYSTFQYPNSSYDWPNLISGNSVLGTVSLATQSPSFVYDINGGTYTLVSFPNASFSSVCGISGNVVVGNYWTTNYTENGFVCNLSNHSYQSISIAGSVTSQIFGLIGNSAKGTYSDSFNNTYLFTYNVSNDSYSFGYQLPQQCSLEAFSSQYLLVNSNNQSLLLYNNNLSALLTTIQYPGSTNSHYYAGGVINGNCILAYSYTVDANHTGHQYFYIYNISNNTYTPISYPGATMTQAYQTDGTNVVGCYFLGNNTSVSYGFIYNIPSQTYNPVGIAGTSDTVILSVSGIHLVGAFDNGNDNNTVMFIGTLPEPAPTPKTPTLGSFTVPAKIYGTGVFTLTPPTSSSGGSWSYSSGNTSVATVSGNTVTIKGVGTAVITATQAPSGNYTGSSTTATFSVGAATPTLGSFTVPAKIYGTGAFTLVAPTSPSAGSWSYSSGNTNVATISGATVTVRGVGSAVITATQAASGGYTVGSTTGNLVVSKGSQAIPAFQSLTNVPYGSVLTLTNSNSSGGLPVSFVVKSGPAKLSSNKISITGVGQVVITASQAGNTNYNAAMTLTNSFGTVKANQTITFTLPATNTFTSNGLIPLAGTDSSGLAITYTSSNSSILTISGTNAVMKGRGTDAVTASQAGSTNYNAAPSVTRTIIIK